MGIFFAAIILCIVLALMSGTFAELLVKMFLFALGLAGLVGAFFLSAIVYGVMVG